MKVARGPVENGGLIRLGYWVSEKKRDVGLNIKTLDG